MALLFFLALAGSPAWAVTISHGPRIGLVTQTATTIYWDTDTAGLGSVKWGTTTSYGSTLSETSSVTNHRLTLTGLAAATTYHYKVSTSTASSADYTFTTAVPSGTDFTFISMADSRGSSATSDLAGLPQAFINIIAKAAAKNAGFALFGGDMFYGSSTQTTQASLYDVWKTATDPLAHNTSLLVAVGNHEMNESSFSTITQFNQEFAQPQTNPSGYPGTVFSFDWGNSHFAIVDTCHVNTSTNCSGGTNNCMYYMFDDMLTWLDSDLAAAQSRGVRHIFVMGHSHAYADSSWTLNYMGNYPTQRDKFWSILVNRKVDAYLCGHIHDFNDALGQQGVVQWLNGNSGASTTNNAYTLWNIHGDTATATLYDDSGSQVTQLVIQSSQPNTCTSPTVSVTAPTSGATVSGNVTLTASVSGSPAATQVVFKVDGTAVATLTASPWSYSWNSASVANGSHSITASATNTCGTTTSAAMPVTISNTAPTYSISGTVTSGGTGLSGVLVSTGSSTVTTDSSGNYTISGLANGTYTVTPTKSGYTFSPTSTSVTISSANKTGVNFTATAVTTTYCISGTITANSAALAGVIVSASGTSGSGSATTDSSGAYTICGLPNGTYTVTPSLSGYTFSPASQSATISSANVTGVNFTGTATTSSGVTNGGFESGLTGWTAGGIVAPTQAANAHHSGSYSCKITGGSSAGDSTIYQAVAVPAAGGTLTFWYYPVSPDTLTYDWQEMDVTNTSGTVLATPLKVCSNTSAWTQVTYDLSAYKSQTVRLMFKVHDDGYSGDTTYMYIDDVAVQGSSATYSISGTVTLSGTGLSTVVISVGSSTVNTDTSGNYTLSGLASGTYTVTPTKSGYTFSPASQSVTISSANVTGVNFTATAVSSTYSISGTITYNSAGLSGVVVTAGTASATTGSGGAYTISGLANGTYTVTPALTGYAFTPASQSVTVSGANKTGVNFTAASTSCGALVVISQVFGGGGNSGAYYNSDFIELFNRGGQAQSLAGWSVQYASASGTTWTVTPLSGTIPAGGYYLIKEYAGSTGTVLPTADVTGTINMSATSGKLALVNSATALTASCPTGGGIQDFVGYGAANCYEGSAAAPALTSTTSAQRAAQGCTDTNNNGSDFTAVTSGASNPAHNSASAHHTCTCS